MAYTLTYWKEENNPESHYEIKSVRLKSINEAVPLALEHKRPVGTDLITVERHRNYKGNRWIDEKTVWDKNNPNEIIDPVKRPDRTKK